MNLNSIRSPSAIPMPLSFAGSRPDQKKLTALGKKLESHPMFPERVNVEFVYFSDAENCRVFFYERGVGPTLASSTGSAAVFAVLRRLGMVRDRLADRLRRRQNRRHLETGDIHQQFHPPDLPGELFRLKSFSRQYGYNGVCCLLTFKLLPFKISALGKIISLQ